MPSIPSVQASLARETPVPSPAPAANPAGSALAAGSTAPAAFTDGIEPRPEPATAYAVHVASGRPTAAVEIGATASTSGPTVPAMAEAGKPLLVTYSRTPQDLGQSGQAREIIMHYRVEDGPVQSRTVADGRRDLRDGRLLCDTVRIDVPADARGEIQYWFELHTEDGRTLWDSLDGHNYSAAIVPTGGSTIRFDDLWGEAVSGPVVAGETLRLAYDADRLKQFLRGTQHHGLATWNITAFVSFDGKAPVELPITVPERGAYGAHVDMRILEAAVKVPADAHEVAIWFRGSAYGGSVFGGAAWDSDYNADYRYPVVARGA